jgi:hypothetical protein
MKILTLVAFAAMMIPTTRVEKVVEKVHGVEVVDPYRWLENQEAPETREWLAAQEKYARSWIDAAPRRAAAAVPGRAHRRRAGPRAALPAV